MLFYPAALIESTELMNKNKTRERRACLISSGKRCLRPGVNLNFSSFALWLWNVSAVMGPYGILIFSICNVALIIVMPSQGCLEDSVKS